ncbi:MAG: macro domain-containing protein [Clostridiales bacterium]|nr:macro domain-containing protein [Clostridiales bacterium]
MGRDIKNLKIYLLDRNPEMYAAWNKHFYGKNNVSIVCSDFVEFMRRNKVDCVVSPANAFGIMDGGYDEAITAWFGNDLQERVQRYIVENLYGEQPVGSSIIIDTALNDIKLIHTPTMRTPSIIKDESLVYHCTRSSLIAALNGGVNSVVVPAFGAATGCVPYDTVALMMWRAYEQLSNPPHKIDWKYAESQSF